MANPEHQAADAEADAFEELYGLSDELVEAVSTALEVGRPEDAAQSAAKLHPADLADLLERLPGEGRLSLVRALGKRLDGEVLSYLDDSVREELVEELNTKQLASLVSDLESDDAVEVVEDLDAIDLEELLRAVPADQRVLIEDSLRYPEDSAGRLMRREVVTVPSFWNVGQTIDFMRSGVDLPDDFYNIIVVGPAHKPLGLVHLSRMLRRRRPVDITEIMEAEPKLIPAEMDQEEVAFLFRQYGLVEAPVVDGDGRLVGVITVDDIVEVIEEEAEEDILKMGGVREDDFYDDVVATTRSRWSWLSLNLLTAIIASAVIALFDQTIEKVVALAVLMPIVASMGGNAGTQTLTVAVRALATNELTAQNAVRIVWKEVLVGGVNGIVFAVLMGVIAWFWFQDPNLGGVIAAAMIINLLIAGFAGTVIPLGLERIGTDPAVGSTVILTTVTDVVGFFCFLGLATWVLL